MSQLDIFPDILQALHDRTEWEERQTTWYQMRHQGLRRKTSPYPGAPDLHFPLIDGSIEKYKPFYCQQLYATEQLASFVSLKTQDQELTSAAGGWFDYKLKQESNLEREIYCGFDHMLMNGSSLVKVYWDADAKKICYDAKDPLHIIAPNGSCDLYDADWLVDVIAMSPDQYKANKNFNQDKAFVKSITGKGDGVTYGSSNSKLQEAARREGISRGKNDDEIIIWEIYRRIEGKVTVQTISPLQPDEDKKVRDDYELPYNLGPFKKGNCFPFVRFRMEIKDKGWYSSRGVSELVAPFEVSMNKQWNSKHEWMDYMNRPTYKSDRDVPNATNIKQLPGQIFPPGVEPNPSVPPPMSIDAEMQTTRAASEWRLNVPDFSLNSHLAGKPGYGGEKATKTQIDAIAGQAGQSDDLRARICRLDLADLYRMSWALLLQYDSASLTYVLQDQMLTLNAEVLHDQYLIVPNGSADSWNKGLQFQKAVNRFQMFRGDPYIGQGELRKTVLEADDTKLIKRLYQDPNIELSDQMEQQAEEIGIMLIGFPARVQDADDDKAHLQGMSGFIDRRTATQEPITPEFARLMLQHGSGHLQGLSVKKDPDYQKVTQAVQPYLQFLNNIAMQSPAMPSNVVAGPGSQQIPGGAGSTGASPGSQNKPPAPPDPIADMSKALTALAAVYKSGLPVGIEQLNAALAEGGIPPITVALPPPAPPIKAQPTGVAQ